MNLLPAFKRSRFFMEDTSMNRYEMSDAFAASRGSRCGDSGSVCLPQGFVLCGQYRIDSVLGKGGFGITYSVTDLKNGGRRLALKELFPGKDAYRIPGSANVGIIPGQELFYHKMQNSFLKEARVLAQFAGYKNICQIFHIFRANNTTYYAMEFLDGMDMRTWLVRNNGPMPWSMLSGMMKELFPTLSAVHNAGIIHRDLSPDNLFITKDGSLRLIDFGSARLASTGALTVFVKDAFAPWEQYLENGNQGPWTDIYALGVTMYLLLTNSLPPRASDRIQGKDVTPLRTLVPNLPPHVADTIHKAIAVRIEDRFQSIEEMSRALFPETIPRQSFPSSEVVLTCISGLFQGKSWCLPEGKRVVIGRRPEQADCYLKYPDNYTGISRKHCTLLRKDGSVFLRDDHSYKGVCVNGTMIEQNIWYRIPSDACIQLANEKFQLRLK